MEVYAVQEVKDEDSGEVFRNEIPVGNAQIVRSDAKQSFGMIEGEDTGIAKGCVVKVVKPLSRQGASFEPAPATAPSEAVSPGSSEKPLKF